MSTSTITRKRSRAQLEQDDLSPEKVRTPTSHSNSKRRKISATDTSGTLIGSIAKGVSKYLGWSGSEKEQENEVAGEEDEIELDSDQLADTPPPAATKKSSSKVNGRVLKADKPKKDIWDLPSSESEKDQKKSVRKLGSGRQVGASIPKPLETFSKDKSRSKKTLDSTAADELESAIETAPDEEQTSKHSTKSKATSTSKKSKAAPTSLTVTNPIKYQHRSPGRPSKSQLLRRAKQLAREGRRENLTAPGEHESEDEEDETNHKEQVIKIPEGGVDGTIIPKRKRGRPRKIKEDPVTSANPTPKGILTPKRGRGRPKGSKKKVLFEHDGEVDLGFKDIPTTVSAKKTTGRGSVVEHVAPKLKLTVASESEEASSEDEPDTPCSVCSKRNSTNKNPILLCDRCDSGYHLKCYGLSELPEEDEWFCMKCRPDQEVSLFPHVDPVEEILIDTPDIEGFEDHLRCMQRIVLDKLTGHGKVKLRGFDEEMQKVHQVVEQTVMAGEGNSMLVIGARGCGKTTLVESVIADLSEQRENFHVVRLNGFVHTDDKLALKEIWRQLGREMEIEDDQTSTSHADILATLLALLSHPSEMTESSSDQTAKSVVFILDEFDLFTTHPRQTLLYNLFDIAQAKKAPIVVLGLTTKVDVVESLEKRVKSRFSHRYVHLSLPRSLPAFWEICKECLVADLEELDAQESKVNSSGQSEFVTFWQKMIEDLYTKDTTFKHCIQSEFYRTKSAPAFFTSCILPIANLSPRNPTLKGRNFMSNSLSLSAPDSKLQILQGLSELELALLIAAARLDIILDTDTCNFAMAYDEYSSLTSRHKIQTSSTGVAALGASAKVWGRDVSLGAWEKLADYELLIPAGIGGGGRDFGAAGRMWKVDVGLEEITGSVDGLSTVMTKWCREI